MAIFVYDNSKGKVVEVKQAPVRLNNTKDHVNMRTTWSNQTKIEFSSKTMSQDIADRRNG
tara:strand:- start:646 stop:825 length:180 start_codon:yes stop_codon:yes gene_type:complete